MKKEAGILGTLLFLLSSYPSVADLTPEPTATPELIPTPHKNSSGLVGRKITYVPVEIEAFSEIWKEMGYSPYIRQHISAVAQDCRDGVFSGSVYLS